MADVISTMSGKFEDEQFLAEIKNTEDMLSVLWTRLLMSVRSYLWDTMKHTSNPRLSSKKGRRNSSDELLVGDSRNE
jgi:hypothetical protein